jgi:hypothetical protein
VILGVEYDLINLHLEITEQRREELRSEIDEILRCKKLTPGHAAKLKGKLMFAATQLWGKLGRAYMLALSERQYKNIQREPRPCTNLNPEGVVEDTRQVTKTSTTAGSIRGDGLRHLH